MHGTDNRPVHPAANIFPMMTDEEIDDLAADIKANGQQLAILVDDQGAILDGRNRFEACRRAGVEPIFETANKKSDPIALVCSLNVKRRNLRASQKAIAAAEAWELAEAHGFVGQGKRTSGQNGPRSKDYFAKLFGVSHSYVQMARALLIEDQVAAAAVKRGGTDAMLKPAYDALQKRKGDAADDLSKMDRLRHDAPDLADRVSDGRLTYIEAISELHTRQRAEREASEAATRLMASTLSALDPGEQTPEQWAERMFNKVDVTLSPDLKKRWTPKFILRCANALAALASQWEDTNAESN